ncbi:dioxygenase [Sphingobium nicotianae]|uniref:Hydroxyquinol 1,2-dioxygenase n=1 Tax=Sphingobium nicotianae TaxID=2782607 RepID=A0A9X1DBA1_9SPHN|nr:dioxygenase [Sphingobium nicotianae]MBT2186769.1 hydroxyquinol 1,2-dioxygenase [Sphingobium nicotianae]
MSLTTEQEITAEAMRRWSTAQDPRLARLLPLLVKHLHAFAREARPSMAEWMAGIEFLTATGRICDDKRQEMILLSDVLGLSMLTVMLNDPRTADATPSTVLGPFHIDASPGAERGSDLADGIDGARLHVRGSVRGIDGAPIGNALLDFWQADHEGFYEAQLGSEEARLRAILSTDERGGFDFWTVMPRGYTIPLDGPVGDLICRTTISHYRPAHLHFIVSAPGYIPLVTHIFPSGADYLDNDVVFGVRQELIVPFEPVAASPDGIGAHHEVQYDFVLTPAAEVAVQPRR